LNAIEWGTLEAGGLATKTIYLKNPGNTAETLAMTTTQWEPVAASSVLTLTWNKEGSTISAGGIVPATLTLQVSADPGTISTFNMNIVISGTA